MANAFKTALIMSLMAGFSAPALAETSPTLLIETGPSDNPAYRRMVHVKYLNGSSVTANYRAYNRREFINVPSVTPQNEIAACARGAATPLRDIKAFERDEARRKNSGKAPERRSFCIKNIPNWTAKNKDKYLDPIFESMPYLAK